MQEIPFLKNRHHRMRRYGWVFFPDHGFMNVRIEMNVYFVDRLHSVPLKDLEQLFVDQQHAFVELVAFLGVLERAVEVVENRKDVPQHRSERVFEEVGLLSFVALAEVLEVGERAKVTILELLILDAKGRVCGRGRAAI